MTLVSASEIAGQAHRGGYAVGGFNAINMETAQAIVAAAEDAQSPVIVQVTQTTLKYTNPNELAAIIRVLADRTSVPVAMHLDHGRSFEIIMRFLALGFTSVMVDGSLQPDGRTPTSYEENVRITRKVVEAARPLGVTVEGEIGTLGQIGRDITEESGSLTDPDQAARFVEDTDVDMLAVSIGTTHGLYRGTPVIDIERVSTIRSRTDVPLVMHGGSFTPDDRIREAVKAGISKVNIDTTIRVAFYDAVRTVVHSMEAAHEEADTKGEPRRYDIRKMLSPARDAMRAAVADRIGLFGSTGKAVR